MAKAIRRSSAAPLRKDLSFQERWRGPDSGLITCWETGRRLAEREPELAERARKGELLVLTWKGGVERKLTTKKHGTLNYLAQWQGLRGDDLDIDPDQEYELTCSKTGMTVIYAADIGKWGVL